MANSRSEIGATENRLGVALSNLQTSILNNEEAASSIRDVDILKETADRVGFDIRTSASIALQAQANRSNTDSVLRLLQGA